MKLTMKDVMTANCAIQHAEMLTSNHCAALARELNKMLAAAPVPPAGEVEVLGSFGSHVEDDIEVFNVHIGEGQSVGMVDRAHVTRLTDENARLYDLNVEKDARMSAMNESWASCISQRDALQSDLTKARELLADAVDDAKRYLASNAGWARYGNRRDEIEAEYDAMLGHQSAPVNPVFKGAHAASYPSEQSAPAAKGGELMGNCEACGHDRIVCTCKVKP